MEVRAHSHEEEKALIHAASRDAICAEKACAITSTDDRQAKHRKQKNVMRDRNNPCRAIQRRTDASVAICDVCECCA
jgi:hypothetical protein